MSQSSAAQNVAAPTHSSRRTDLGAVCSIGGTAMSGRFAETEWEARESQRQRELEEARARAAQMEKTMKWWSDCTANWREKWSKVRNERNKAREESKQLRANLDLAMKEANSYKREKNDLEMQITQLKKEMEKIHALMMKHAGEFNRTDMIEATEDAEANCRDCSPDISSDGLKNVNSEDGLVTKAVSNDAKDLDIEEYILKGALPKNITELDEVAAEEKRLLQQLSRDDFDEEYLLQKISMLQLRLDEAQKTLQAERDEKNELHKNIEKLTLEVQDVRVRQEELRAAKQEAVRELLTLQEQHRAEMRIINNSLQEEIAARENLERRLSELRTELERLQAENASEWGKRERLETEKLALERDNKKLRSELRDYQERSDRKNRPLQASDVEVRALQQELTERNKEISEMKLSHAKLKKLFAENNTELVHAVRRAEQYEAEVKRLRQRVEELKRELATAEDELDSAVNQVRRLQRTNDELVGQSEGLQVQIQHLQTRHFPSPQLRNGSSGGGVQLRNKIAVELPTECLPNINNLRQIFDDSQAGLRSSTGNNGELMANKRSSCSERTLSNALADAKLSHVEDNIAETKSRNMEFERVKQKFDNPTSSSSAHHHYQQQQQQQRHHHHQRERERERERERSLCRYGAGNQVPIDRSNLVLPLKGIANNGFDGGANTNSLNMTKEDINRQLFDDYSHSASLGAGGVAVVGAGAGAGECGGQYVKKEKTGAAAGYARNSINLDGLKVSDDEELLAAHLNLTSLRSYGSTSLLLDNETEDNSDEGS